MKFKLLIITFIILTRIAVSATITVVNSGFTFSPAAIPTNPGDTLIFTLASIHNVIEVSQPTYNLNGNTPLPGGISLPHGGGTVFTAHLTPGTHWFVCGPHASMGMKGKFLVQSTTQTPEIPDLKNILIYPNPVVSNLNIKLPPDLTADINLTNSLGEILEHKNNTGGDQYFDLGDKPKGNYYILISDQNGNAIIRKIIKQ